MLHKTVKHKANRHPSSATWHSLLVSEILKEPDNDPGHLKYQWPHPGCGGIPQLTPLSASPRFAPCRPAPFLLKTRQTGSVRLPYPLPEDNDAAHQAVRRTDSIDIRKTPVSPVPFLPAPFVLYLSGLPGKRLPFHFARGGADEAEIANFYHIPDPESGSDTLLYKQYPHALRQGHLGSNHLCGLQNRNPGCVQNPAWGTVPLVSQSVFPCVTTLPQFAPGH